MPYIKKDRREGLAGYSSDPAVAFPQVAGELNYEFTQLIIQYLKDHGLSYQTGNDVLGALDACAREFYDRVMRPYEDKKIRENGDVYPKEFLSLPPEPRPIDPKKVGDVFGTWEIDDTTKQPPRIPGDPRLPVGWK